MAFQPPCRMPGRRQGQQIQGVKAHGSTEKPARSAIMVGNAMCKFLMPLHLHTAPLLHDPRVMGTVSASLCNAQ